MVSYRLILGLCGTLIVQAYSPQNIMVDVTNDFGVCVLQLVASKNENVAFSPYGMVTVALILYEGSAGPTAAEIHNALRLPWQRDVTRIGFRDLHRYLKSYFTNDGFLRGLVLSRPNVVLRTNYTELLDFYGFDIRTGVTTVRPITTVQQPPDTTPSYVPSTTPRAPDGPPTTDTATAGSRTTPDMTRPVTTMPPTTRRTTTERRKTTTATRKTTTTAPRTTTKAPQTTVTTERRTTTTSAPSTTTTSPRMTTTATKTQSTVTVPTTVTTRPTTPPITEETATQPSTRPMTTETTTTITTVTMKRPPMPDVMSQTNDTATTIMTPESKNDEMDIDVQTTTESPSEMMTVTEIVEKKTTASRSTSGGVTTPINETTGVDQMVTSSSEIESVTLTTVGSDQVQTTTMMPPGEAETTTDIESVETTIGTTGGVTSTGSPPVPTDNEFSGSQTQEKATRHERSLHSAHLALEHRDGLSNWVPHYKDPRWNLAGEQWFFTYSDGESVPVLTYTAYLPFAYVPDLQSLVLQIPLDDPRYSMVIILPEERLAMFDVLYLLQWCPLKNVLSQLKTTAVYAVIPSFTLVKHINLRPVMTQLGIRSLFDPYRADLSTMSSEPNLFVKTIEQVVTVSLRKYYSNHRWFDATPSEVQNHFIANHPFLYFVIDRETEVTLMAGTIVNPRAHPQ